MSIDLMQVKKLADEVWDTTKFKFPGDANHRIFVRKVKAENGERERTVCEVIVDSFDTRDAEKLANLLVQTPNMLGVLIQVFLTIGDGDSAPELRSIKNNTRQILECL